MSRTPRWKRPVSLPVALMLAAAAPVLPAAAQEEIVDVELVLAVDVSLSMSPDELNIQRDGYARALTDPRVLKAIGDGAYGKIAVTYMEWAGDAVQRVIVPWSVISNGTEAEAFARALTASPPGSARRTSISSGLAFAAGLFDESRYRGLKQVIDISGDGPNNQGTPVTQVRDRILNAGITINGLPLMTDGGLTSSFDVNDLDQYYTHCVIGGPGAFMIPVNEWSQFPEAIRRKLVLELAGPLYRDRAAVEAARPPVVKTAQSGAQSGTYDCMIGEKMWMNRSWMWEQR